MVGRPLTERRVARATGAYGFIGQFVAAAWSDGVVRLMGLENNKAAHSIRVLEGGQAVISHVAWTSNSVSKKARQDSGSTSNWQRILGKEAAVPDLPREIMFLEVDTALPKISPLPSGSAGSGCVFLPHKTLGSV